VRLGVRVFKRLVDVIVWDASPATPRTCAVLARLLAAGTFQGRGLVVTTTDARSFRTHFKGPAQGLCILQKPYDIDMMLRLLELIPRAPMLDMGAACYATPALELRPEP
jgi:hypothetical protein